MRRLVPAARDPRAVFDACAERTQNAALRTQLLACGPTIALLANEYEELAKNSALNTFSDTELYPLPAPRKELGELYARVLRDGGERPTYDSIMQLAHQSICPQCGIGRVRTLDHYLPKGRFPELAVVPLNLVPTCRDCNFDKNEHHSSDEGDYVFHPYFDDWDQYRLVSATIAYQPYVSIKYSIGSPHNAPPIVITRATTHFRVLNLAALYSMNAGASLAEIKVNCLRASTQGAALVRDYLRDQEDAAVRSAPNGWRAAMYSAMAKDDAFWNGAYNLI
ncbi:hypothetical protein [Bradyrhizobium japonicum]|uniref:hypothetical protein n=1 Tax=Bradyrhizobium japonicum TaxID=375 RepID=UPI001BAAF984|nr:hypothetical protein [Bradyrhizobium japonicum]MBR0960842.1 hypothetical protein [Bradyrhizobium japonicum]